MKKLYVVTLTLEVIVAAESREKAEEEVGSGRHLDDDPDVSAAPMLHLPSRWDEGCIAYGNNSREESDRTVGEWIALGAAPEYVALNERLAKKIAKVTP